MAVQKSATAGTSALAAPPSLSRLLIIATNQGHGAANIWTMGRHQLWIFHYKFVAYSQGQPTDYGLHNCTSTFSVTQEHGKAPSLATAVTAELDFYEQFCCQGRKPFYPQKSSSAKCCVPCLSQPACGQMQQHVLGSASAEHSCQPENYELSAPSLGLLPRTTSLAFLFPVILDSRAERTLETTQPFPSDMTDMFQVIFSNVSSILLFQRVLIAPSLNCYTLG